MTTLDITRLFILALVIILAYITEQLIKALHGFLKQIGFI